eukprot:4418509-Prymnesium_polylepis.1
MIEGSALQGSGAREREGDGWHVVDQAAVLDHFKVGVAGGKDIPDDGERSNRRDQRQLLLARPDHARLEDR